MRRLTLAICWAAFAAHPAFASDGLFVWNDPQAMSIRMVTLDPGNPAKVTGTFVLETLKSYSETMTAVASDGAAIGLCHQRADGNESPASISGFDRKGRKVWEVYPRDLYAALAAALPKGEFLPSEPDWLTFSCVNGGATGKPGVVAFDIAVSAGLVAADGAENWDGLRQTVLRLHLAGKSGRLLAAGPKDAGLALGRNPDGDMPGAGFDFPEGGRGPVFWAAEPIRWKGDPVVNGFDFAWWLPGAG